MICRLCLRTINPSNAVFLFETNETLAETTLVKMIAKFLQLEITPDDSISTSVCTECCEHLEDFNTFWQLVEQKQGTLKKEFLTVDVDCVAMKWTGEVDVDVNIDELPLVAVEMDEKPLDMHNLSLLGSVLDVNVDSVEVPQAPPGDIKIQPTDYLSEEDGHPSHIEATDSEFECEPVPEENTSDDEPLVKLQDKLKPKRRSHPRTTKTREDTCSLGAQELNYLSWAGGKYLSELKVHFLEAHQREFYIKCCNKVFTRASKLMDHIRKHVNPKLFTCSICQKTLNSQDYLATHIETVHNKVEKLDKVLQFPCSKCERTFSSERRLANHLAKHDTATLEHICHICHKNFANVHRLRRHIQSIHEDLHRHVCDICGKKFKFKPSFERHLREHQGVVAPAMQCPVCGVWLKNEHSLRLHRFTHDSTNTACPHCSKTCNSRTALRAHIKYAHKLTTSFQCTYCEKTFKQQRNLDEHLAIHTGLQLYNCPHCPKECRSRSNMYVHIKQRHAEEWLTAKMARSHNPQFKPHA
ncbi:GL14972 [Drosophila persimilis]|uniref:GL14972 n=1 Tax=Drosophila persimilis TaxID=7234 RepID=B4H0C9_DROPE|nr:GL14972 [Drosophila persimilis]